MAEPLTVVNAPIRRVPALTQAAIVTVPLIAWSRDIAVATLILAALGLAARVTEWRTFMRELASPPALFAGLLVLWSVAAIFWAPHLPWQTWLKTVVNIGLSVGLAALLLRQPHDVISKAATAALVAALALAALLAIERFTGGFFVGLHRSAETEFQRLTTLSGGLVLLCTTCFASGLLLGRFVGALIAVPVWICAVLGLSLAYPMDAEVAAVLAGAFVLIAVLICGRAAAVGLMTLLMVGMLGWGFVAESAADAGLHHWLMANVDPNYGYRVEIWRYVSGLIKERVLAGYGFDSARALGSSATLLPAFDGKTSFLHPHNGMLQLWLELGLVGVTLLVTTAVVAFRSFLRRCPSRLALAVVCATSTTTSVIWSLSFGTWQGWWLAVMGLTAAATIVAVSSISGTTGNRKRLLFLVTEYYFFDALKKELTEGARAHGYEIVVAARCRPEDFAKAADITLIPCDWKRSPSLFVSLLYFVPDLVRVARLLNRVNPEVLHNIALKPSVIGSLAAVGRHMRVVNAIHGFGFLFLRHTLFPRLIQAACGLVLKLSSRFNESLLLLINRSDYALARDRMGLSETGLRLIPGAGIDLQRFPPKPEPSGTFTFLVIGRLLYMKGTDVVIEAHRILRERGLDSNLVICGSPDPDNPSSIPEHVLKEWASRPGVILAGQVPDVRPYLEACHVLIHPSLGGEGLPRALTEAAASCRALIATEIPGNTEVVIRDRTGLLVPPKDAGALATAMQWMIEHPAERQLLAQAARSLVEQEFSSIRVLQTHTGILRELE